MTDDAGEVVVPDVVSFDGRALCGCGFFSLNLADCLRAAFQATCPRCGAVLEVLKEA